MRYNCDAGLVPGAPSGRLRPGPGWCEEGGMLSSIAEWAAVALQAYIGKDEKLQLVGGDIWIFFSRQPPSSRLLAATNRKRFGVGTSRNWNTVRKLAEMVCG